MCPRKSALFYSEEELVAIREKWLEDKKRIDDNPAYEYYVDRWNEYEKHLNNGNLRTLFGHAAHLYRHLQENELLFLYEGEDLKITEAFWRIVENGYYDRSKEKEREVRSHLGKIVKRQTYRRFKRKS